MMIGLIDTHVLSDRKANTSLLKVSHVVLIGDKEDTIVSLSEPKLSLNGWCPVVMVVVGPFTDPLSTMAVRISHLHELLLTIIFVLDLVEGKDGVSVTLDNTVDFFVISSVRGTCEHRTMVVVEAEHLLEESIFVSLLVVLESFGR